MNAVRWVGVGNGEQSSDSNEMQSLPSLRDRPGAVFGQYGWVSRGWIDGAVSGFDVESKEERWSIMGRNIMRKEASEI